MADLIELFLNSRRSPNTRRSYEHALSDVQTNTGKSLDQVAAADVAAWVTAMSAAGLASSTINQRLAALRSFYRFCDEMDQPMINPVRASLRRPVQPYGRAGFLRPEQARGLLASIDRSTPQGKRDYALFLLFIATGRRSTEIRDLRHQDIEKIGVTWIMHWHGKGNKFGKIELPGQVVNALKDFIGSVWVDREPEGGDFIFVAIPALQAREQRGLSATTVSRLLRKYARRVGITGRIHIHMLRHTAAMLRKKAGMDVLDIQGFLGHANVSITQIYLQHLEEKADTTWASVADMLGLGGG